MNGSRNKITAVPHTILFAHDSPHSGRVIFGGEQDGKPLFLF